MKLLRTDILVDLPTYTEERIRERESGILVDTLNEKLFYPRHGTVITTSDKVLGLNTGDTVFFSWIAWDKAKECAWGVTEESGGTGSHQTCFALKDEQGYKMIMPIQEVLLAKRGDELIACNNYVVCEPIHKQNTSITINGGVVQISETVGSIAIVDVSHDSHKMNQAKVVLPNDSGMPIGATCYTLKHCDIPIEEEIDKRLLDKTLFAIEREHIVAYEKDGKLCAGADYVLVKRDEPTTSKNGIFLSRPEPQFTGIVYDGKGYKEGDKVLFERKNFMQVGEYTAIFKDSIFLQ